MAKLVPILSEARLPAVSGAAEADARYPLSTVGANLQRLGDKGLDVAGVALAAAVAAREEGEATRAYAATTEHLDKLKIELDKDPDYAGREAKFNAAARQVEKEAMGTLSGRAAQEYQRRLAPLYQANAHAVRTQAGADERQYLRVRLDQDTDTLLEAALAARNPFERKVKLDELKNALERAQATGTITAAMFASLHKSKLEKFDEITVSRVMRTAPGAAMALLNDKTATPNLDPLRREQLKIQAQARGEQMAALASATTRAAVGEVVGLFDAGIKPENAERARALAGRDKKLTAALDDAEGRYHASAQFREMGAADRAAAIAAVADKEKTTGLTLPEARLLQTYNQTSQRIAAAYDADPKATAMQRNTAAADAYASALRAGDMTAARTALVEIEATQRRDGVPERKIALLTKGEAEHIEAKFGEPPSQARTDFINATMAQYGPALWPRAFRQLNAGQKLPADAKIIGAIGPGQLSNDDAMTISRAHAVPDAKWDELIPATDQRKAVKTAVFDRGAAMRETMVRAPNGGPDAYADFAASADRVAKLLLAEKRASSPEDAAKQAWDIVGYNHWATAGSVRIPKQDGRPIADPKLIAAYPDYFKREVLPGLLLEPPPVSPGTARLSPEQRMDMRRRTLASHGYWLADRDERGMVLMDGNGLSVNLATLGPDGKPLPAQFDWRTIQSDAAFLRWYARRGANAAEPPATPGILGPGAPKGETREKRDRFQNMPGIR